MLSLVLNSHPQVRSIDESDFLPQRLGDYLSHDEFHPCVAVKLPISAHLVPAFSFLDGLKVLWCLRDPRDVVASMLKLQLRMHAGAGGRLASLVDRLLGHGRNRKTSWTAHPNCARLEIQKCAQALHARAALGGELTDQLAEVRRSLEQPPQWIGRAAQVRLGALCWRLKQEVYRVYYEDWPACHVVTYEDLVTMPKEQIGILLDFLELPWSEEVLHHHRLHKGTSIGETDNSRSIDSRSLERWRKALSAEDLVIVAEVCGPATNGRYDLSSEAQTRRPV